MFEDRNNSQYKNVRNAKTYDYIFPEHVDKSKVSFYYDYELTNPIAEKVLKSFKQAVQTWVNRWKTGKKPLLYFKKGLEHITIIDGRSANQPKILKISGIHSLIFLDTIDTPKSLPSLQQKRNQLQIKEDEWNTALNDLINDGIVIDRDQKFFNLALPVNNNWNHEEAA
jgi:hypothetical protein